MDWDDIWKDHRHISDYSISLYSYLDAIASELPHKARILEAGCGLGNGLKIFDNHGLECVGIDISTVAVKKTNEVPNINSAQASILNLPFKEGIFDLTYNSGVIEHFHHPKDIDSIKEMVRVTIPGGRVIVIVPNMLCPWYFLLKKTLDLFDRWPFGFESSYSVRGLKRAVNETGELKIKEIFGLLPLPPTATHNLEILPFKFREKLVKLAELLPKKQLYSYAIGAECVKL